MDYERLSEREGTHFRGWFIKQEQIQRMINSFLFVSVFLVMVEVLSFSPKKKLYALPAVRFWGLSQEQKRYLYRIIILPENGHKKNTYLSIDALQKM